MKTLLSTLLFVIVLISGVFPVAAEQRDFPTGESGANVTYLDAAGPQHPTACVVAITAGLPALAVSLALFSNNTFTIMVASEQPIPIIAPDSAATIKLNSTYIFSKVRNAFTSGHFHVVNLIPVGNTSIHAAYEATNQIVSNTTSVDVVADDAQMPSINIPAEPGVAVALKACQQYLITH